MSVPWRRTGAAESDVVPSPFVGRRAHLAVLRAALTAAAAGRGGLVLVGGEPGIGKTYLAERLAADAPAAGADALWAACHERAAAFWPWTQLIRALRRKRGPDVVPAGLGPEDADPRYSRDRLLLFQRITAYLCAAAARRPLLLVLDDLHCADVASLQLLEFLAREARASPLLVVGAYRDTETEPGHPLREMVGSLAGSRHHVVLRGLAGDEVIELVAHLTGTGPDGAVASSLHERTGGNPLFLRELLLLGEAHGRDGTLPDGVREVVARRLRRLSPECRALLDAAAVTGQRFPAPLVGAVVELPWGRLDASLDEAVRARLLERVPGAIARYQFAHALVREALYQELDAGHRRSLHRCAAAAIERVLDEDDLENRSARLAHHLRHVGDRTDRAAAASHALEAGHLAVRHLAYETAIGHFEDALDLLESGDPPSPERRCDVLLALADAAMRAGRTVLARATYERAADAARAAGSTGALARAALGVGVGVTAGVVDDLEIRLLDEALVAVGDSDRAVQTRLLGRLAAALHSTSSLRPRQALGDQAIASARRLADPGALAATLLDRCSAVGGGDTVENRLSLCDEAVQLAGQAGDHVLALRARLMRMGALLELGDLDSVRVELEICDRMARELRLQQFAWRLVLVRSSQSVLAGRLAEAEALAVEALAAGRRVQHPGVEVFQLGLLTVIRSLQGRMGELVDPLRDTVARYPSIAGWRCSLAFSLCSGGRVDEARREFEVLAAENFRGLPRSAGPSALASIAVVCDALGDARRAATLHARLAPFADQVVALGLTATGCLGAASHYLGVLSCTMERWEEACAHLEAAIEINGRIGARPFVANSRLQYARALRGMGGADALRRAADQARLAEEMAGALGLRLWPGGAGTSAPASQLSRREWEVARLVAAGLGNREIAERLCISKRTAETHVDNIRNKLGVGARAGIVSWVVHTEPPSR